MDGDRDGDRYGVVEHEDDKALFGHVHMMSMMSVACRDERGSRLGGLLQGCRSGRRWHSLITGAVS